MSIRLEARNRGNVRLDMDNASLAAKYAREAGAAEKAAELSAANAAGAAERADAAAEAALRAEAGAQSAAVHLPRPGENGTWLVWDQAGDSYVDSGENCTGVQGERGLKGDTGDKGDKGDTGSKGDDGVSPTVTVTDITGGHRVTITDANHPQGQPFDVMDGEVAQEDFDELSGDVDDLNSALDDQRQIYNLFPKKYSQIDVEGNPVVNNGITFDVQANGEVILTGTATGASTFFFCSASYPYSILPAGTYRFFTDNDLSNTGVRVRGKTVDAATYFTFKTYPLYNEYTITENTQMVLIIAVDNGTVIPEGGIRIRPMIVNAADTFHGYIAPWASLAAYVPEIFSELEGIKSAEDTSFGPIDTVRFESGGLSASYGETTSNTRIRVVKTTMPQMFMGDFIAIDSKYEAKIYACNSTRYGSSVAAELTPDFINGVFRIPEQYSGLWFGVLLRKVGQESSDISGDVATMSQYVRFYTKQYHYLDGFKFAVMGDSMSALAGYIPEGNTPYYSGMNHGIQSVSQMWWSVVGRYTGMQPLVINAWSGSAVSQLEDSAHANITPMSSDSRCENLSAYIQSDSTDPNAILVTSENISSIKTSPFMPAYTPAIGDYVKKVDPDVVIIAGGTNDYSYAMSAQSEPLPWDGKTAPILGDSFTEAYACMIKKIQAAYPQAIIVCCSTWFVIRGTDNGYTWTHTSGTNIYTQADYDAAIRNVCEQMRVPYICINNIGFNRNNYYLKYAPDNPEIPTHMDCFGHYVAGRAIVSKILDLISGYLRGNYRIKAE